MVNESCVASVIAALTLTLGVNGPNRFHKSNFRFKTQNQIVFYFRAKQPHKVLGV